MGPSGSYAPPKGMLFVDPRSRPIYNNALLPLSNRYFYMLDGVTPAPVFQDGGLTTSFTQPVTAGTDGRFLPIYLDPSIAYSTKLYNATGTLIENTNPLIEQPLNIVTSVLATALPSQPSLTSTPLYAEMYQGPGASYAFEIYLDISVISGASPSVNLLVGASSTIDSTKVNSLAVIGGTQTPTYAQIGNQFTVTLAAGRNGIWLRGAVYPNNSGGQNMQALELSWNAVGGDSLQMNAGSYMIARPLTNYGILFQEPQSKPLQINTSIITPMPGAYRLFYYSGGYAPAIVYADAGLQRPMSQVIGQAPPSCTADISGRFSPIYMDPAVAYRVVTYNASGALQESIDPYVPRAFEIISAVKLVPTIRPVGTGVAPDPALQITLNPGVYAIESILEFAASTSGMTSAIEIAQVAGAGSIASSGYASSVVFESNASGATYGQLAIGTLQTLNLATSPFTSILLHGSVTITGGSVTLGISWSAVGTAGNQVAITAGSYLVAQPVG